MPNQTMMSGASAIFGNPLSATISGRRTAAPVGVSQSSKPAAVPARLPMRKPSTVSCVVTQLSRSRAPDAKLLTSSRQIPVGWP